MTKDGATLQLRLNGQALRNRRCLVRGDLVILRVCIREAHEAGLSLRAIAEAAGVSKSWVHSALQSKP